MKGIHFKKQIYKILRTKTTRHITHTTIHTSLKYFSSIRGQKPFHLPVLVFASVGNLQHFLFSLKWKFLKHIWFLKHNVYFIWTIQEEFKLKRHKASLNAVAFSETTRAAGMQSNPRKGMTMLSSTRIFKRFLTLNRKLLIRNTYQKHFYFS